MLEKDYKWIVFKREPAPHLRTQIFSIWHKHDTDVFLGEVKWYSPWRGYCFFPEHATLFSKSCIDDISDFINQLMVDHRASKKQAANA